MTGVQPQPSTGTRRSPRVAIQRRETAQTSAVTATLHGQPARQAVGIAIVDPAGRVREANDPFLALLGVTRSALEKGHVSWEEIAPRSASYRWRC